MIQGKFIQVVPAHRSPIRQDLAILFHQVSSYKESFAVPIINAEWKPVVKTKQA